MEEQRYRKKFMDAVKIPEGMEFKVTVVHIIIWSVLAALIIFCILTDGILTQGPLGLSLWKKITLLSALAVISLACLPRTRYRIIFLPSLLELDSDAVTLTVEDKEDIYGNPIKETGSIAYGNVSRCLYISSTGEIRIYGAGGCTRYRYDEEGKPSDDPEQVFPIAMLKFGTKSSLKDGFIKEIENNSPLKITRVRREEK